MAYRQKIFLNWLVLTHDKGHTFTAQKLLIICESHLQSRRDSYLRSLSWQKMQYQAVHKTNAVCLQIICTFIMQ